MSNAKKSDKSLLSRSHPPVMPMGFRVGISNEIMVVDFVDTPNTNEAVIFSSIVLTKETAKNLLESLTSFVES
jgi:hypothetical protein